ncbi:MAG: NAD(P)/FAD-dependent oxidoreductase [Actinobacteria bacterium]|nr:NAD(P)/FAD-dependent oxidoreductase [Actinomycetota bacterium]
MKPGKKVVVIGSGVGGAGIAALLQSRGHEVTLLEKNGYHGGKCSSFVKDGYVVDSGVHMYSMGPSGPLGMLNRRVGGDLEWCVANPMSDIISSGRVHMLAYQNQFDPRGLLENLKAVALDKRITKEGMHDASKRMRLLEKETYRAAKRMRPREVLDAAARIARRDEALLSELDGITLQEFAHQVTDDFGLLGTLATLCMVLLVVPYTLASAGEFLWCYASIYRNRSLGVPRGSAREVPGSYLRAFLRAGGEFRLGCKVKGIRVENGRVLGVESAEGEFFPADVVVSNAGIKRTLELAGEDNFPPEYVAYVRGLRYSYSFITVKYGLARRVVDVGAPSFFNKPHVHPDHMFDYIDEGGVPEDPLLFVPMPSEWDPFVAPVGKQLLIMGVPGPSEVTPEKVEQCERILDRAEDKLYELFPAVRDNAEWKMRTHISHTAAITGKPTGECIGLAQCVGQTGLAKPSCRTPVEGLWLVGTDAGARGVGTEQAAASALYLAGLLDA